MEAFTNRTEVRYIRLHDLRHTSATLLINQGVHAKIISERLGHADIRITMVTYGHALQTADEEAAKNQTLFFLIKKTADEQFRQQSGITRFILEDKKSLDPLGL